MNPLLHHRTLLLLPVWGVLLFLAGAARGPAQQPASLSQLQVGDLDGDGEHSVYDLTRLINHLQGTPALPAPQVPVADLNQDGAVDSTDVEVLTNAILGAIQLPALALCRVAETSPVSGEPGVAVTRETIIRLTHPIADPSTVTSERFFATFANESLPARINVSPDRLTLTLFYHAPLPASAQVRVTLIGDDLLDENGLAVDGDGDGLPGGTFRSDFSTLSLTVLEGTAVCGRVFASEPDLADGGQMVNRPLGGVTITVDGMEDTLFAVTDDMGNFRLEPAPAGRFFVHIDGRTSNDPNIPPGAYYPFVGKSWQSIPGQETTIGDVYLPLVIDGSLVPVSAGEVTSVAFPTAITDAFPELAGTSLQVPAGSLFADDGTRGGRVGIAPVDPARLPGQLPDNLNFPLVITVQTDGATNFDEPVPVCFPNLPDPETGEVLAPGEKTALWSFNHDTGRFEVIGSMTVSADGTLVCSDPGVGILAPGWHGVQRGAGGAGGDLLEENEPENPNNGAGEVDPRNQNEGPPEFREGDPPKPPDRGHESIEGPTTVVGPGDSNIPGEWPQPCLLDLSRLEAAAAAEANSGTYNGNPGSGQGSSGSSGSALEMASGKNATDPVHYHSGEFYLAAEDLRIKGRGMDFIWKRTYRSRLGRNTAQGNGWDYSYNVLLFRDGEDLVVCNGGARVDRFKLLPNGTWGRPDKFIICRIGPALDYRLEFEDGGIWEFYALDGSPAAGRLARVTDRNGNRIQLQYDFGNGRLIGIIDTLGRRITIEHTADGHIGAIQDFTGRRVEYEYVTNPNDPRGNVGDLVAVRSPTVVGTPNGNDFPGGKRTTYTYSKHPTDPNLRSNLLTVTDPRRNDPSDSSFGQGPYLVNSYATTTDKSAITYDRILRQQWGNPGDVVDLHYTALKPYGNIVRHTRVQVADTGDQAPAPTRGVILAASSALTVVQPSVKAGPDSRFNYSGATTRTIVNDRNGNVTAYFYNASNQLVQKQEFTGRADPDRPTTSLTKGLGNAPGDPLRPGDPRLFRTAYQYNANYLLRRITHPSGNRTEYVYESDLNPNADRRALANVREVRRYPFPAFINRSDQPVLVDRYEYDFRFSACGSCGFRFVTKHTDPRGNITRHSYDHVGNRTRTVERLASVVHDYEYNQFGQRTAHVLPDNGSGHRRRDEYAYHAAGPQAGYLASETIDSTGAALTTTFDYDAVGNVTRTVDPRGNDSQTVYNQLDQPVRSISREVTAGSGVRYTRDFFYDANNNLVRLDVENLDPDGTLDPNPHLTTTWQFETLNHPVRMTREVDANRNIVTEFRYDANRNLILTRKGEATNGNQPGNVAARSYDERNLLLTETLAPGTPNQSTTRLDYDSNRNLTAISQGLEGTPRVTLHGYDGYDRLITSTDPMGNRTSYTYDPNGNVVITRLDGELEDLPGATANNRLHHVETAYDALDRPTRIATSFFDPLTQAALGDGLSVTTITYSDTSQQLTVTDDNNHTTAFTYDTVNRLATTTDARGNSTTNLYDANSNLVATTGTERDDTGGPDQVFTATFDYDGLDRRIAITDNRGNATTFAYDSRNNVVGTVDPLGNTVTTVYDGLDRPVEVTRTLREGGTGSGNPAGSIVTRQGWDDSNRLVQQVDPNGNVTETVFDSLDRTIATRYADQSQTSSTFDVHHNVVSRTDANGSITTTSYDLLDRPVEVLVSAGAGVSGQTTTETYAYDGRSRLVRATDDDATVLRNHDSLSNVTLESINGQVSTATYDGVGNMLSCRYPGGREIAATYDALNRKAVVTDLGTGSLLASHHYVGPARLARRDSGNGTRVDFTYNGITGVPDAPGDFGVKKVTSTRHSTVTTGAPLAHHRYRWDRLGNKIARTDEGTATTRTFRYDSAYRLVATDDAGDATSYALDAAHNRTAVAGTQDPGNYVLDGTLPEPADAQLNQYTSTPLGARSYDRNGNLVTSGAFRVFSYDYRNQMVVFADGGTTATYQYDPLGRRITRTVNGYVTRYLYSPGTSRVCEEQDENHAPLATYVHGGSIDDVIQMQRGGNDYYYHTDDLFSTVALTDSSGNVVEAAAYDDYGNPRSASGVGNPFLFTGRRFDPETGFYYYRTRYLDPRSGRFTTRDTIGIWGDPAEFGNGYAYVGNNPWTLVDPMGASAWRWVRSSIALGASFGTMGTGAAMFFTAATATVAAPGLLVAGGAVFFVGTFGLADSAKEYQNLWRGRKQERAITSQLLSKSGALSARNADTAASLINVAANIGPGLAGQGMATAVGAGANVAKHLDDAATYAGFADSAISEGEATYNVLEQAAPLLNKHCIPGARGPRRVRVPGAPPTPPTITFRSHHVPPRAEAPR